VGPVSQGGRGAVRFPWRTEGAGHHAAAQGDFELEAGAGTAEGGTEELLHLVQPPAGALRGMPRRAATPGRPYGRRSARPAGPPGRNTAGRRGRRDGTRPAARQGCGPRGARAPGTGDGSPGRARGRPASARRAGRPRPFPRPGRRIPPERSRHPAGQPRRNGRRAAERISGTCRRISITISATSDALSFLSSMAKRGGYCAHGPSTAVPPSKGRVRETRPDVSMRGCYRRVNTCGRRAPKPARAGPVPGGGWVSAMREIPVPVTGGSFAGCRAVAQAGPDAGSAADRRAPPAAASTAARDNSCFPSPGSHAPSDTLSRFHDQSIDPVDGRS
jgi:hypothetical protein